jgi:hypothetical protein
MIQVIKADSGRLWLIGVLPFPSGFWVLARDLFSYVRRTEGGGVSSGWYDEGGVCPAVDLGIEIIL